MSVGSTEKGLLTPTNCAVVFLDHQPHVYDDVGLEVRQELLNAVLVLAKAAQIFQVPVIITALESGPVGGEITPQLLEVFPAIRPIKRSCINAWDDPEFVAAVRATHRRNILISALWCETSLVFPAVQMLEEGFGIYAVEDASASKNTATRLAAIRRIEQAGAVSLTALQALLELQRDWSRHDHSSEVLGVLKEHYAMSSKSQLIPQSPSTTRNHS